MFEFTFEDIPTQNLMVETAEISLFAQVPPYRDTISLYVTVTTKPTEVKVPDADGDEGADSRLEVKPVFYTEWLEVPLSALKGKKLDLLDGYRLSYDLKTEKEDGFVQFPGAIYDGFHAGFTRATMALTYRGGSTYRVEAEGQTEFGWTFKIDTEANLTKVSAKSGRDNGDKQPSGEVEEWFAQYFNAATFPPAWTRRGADDFNWQALQAFPVVEREEKNDGGFPMNYMLVFSSQEGGGHEVEVTDRFLAWYEEQEDGPKKLRSDRWRLSSGGSISRTSDADGVAVTTEGVDRDSLYRVLAYFFAFTAKGVGHVAISSTAVSGGVALVSSDPRLVPDPTGAQTRGLAKTFRASDVLVGMDKFTAFHDVMFGRRGVAQDADGDDEAEVASEMRTLGAGPWIFADLRPPADSASLETISFLVEAGSLSPGEVMGRVLDIPEVRVHADDYFTYEDATNTAQVMGQPFPTDAGKLIEIRLELPPGLSEAQIRARMTSRFSDAGLTGAWFVEAYDDAKGAVTVSALKADGALGDGRVLKMTF